MSTEFGDLVVKKLTAKLPDAELRERIINFFKEQTMCVIATCKENVPRATPLEYFSDGMTLYISTDPGTKIENIKVNAMVSIGIFSTLHPDWAGDNWKRNKGAQITGEATILGPDDPENIRAKKEVIPWKRFVSALGWDISKLPKGLVVKVEPKKIEYRENALMLKGYATKQVWEAST